ncbi:hypothetical protein LWI29_038553 [Acer saccharum]|uniref:homogentisate 1,2-dioxygenase n=1 Tax=Acer saccharum TaxID=4024 RepID=A0AA39SZR1_ACESA|nr:hypothetical protein LWI29_038553 [Acer saccharum]
MDYTLYVGLATRFFFDMDLLFTCTLLTNQWTIVPSAMRMLWITTECGRLQVSPGEIVVFTARVPFFCKSSRWSSRGYVAEIFGSHFQLPDLGPIGANGLAAPRDFLVPTCLV